MVKKNIIANFVGQGWVALMNLAFIPVYIKYLGIEAYGLIGIFAILQTLMALLDLGMTPTLNREMARFSAGDRGEQEMRDLLRTTEILSLVVALAIAGGVWFASNWLATTWIQNISIQVTEAEHAFEAMGFVLSLRLLEGIYKSCIGGLQRQVLLNVINGLLATVRSVGAIVILVYVSPTITTFFVWQALIYLVALFAYAYLTYAILPNANDMARFSMVALKSVFAFASGLMGTVILSLLLTQIDKIMLTRLLPLTEYGYYTLASTVAGGLFVLIAPVVQAWFPRLCELHANNDEEEMVIAYHKGAQLISVVAGSAAIVLILYSEMLLTVWSGDAVLAKEVAPLLSLLALGNLLNGLMHMPYQAQLAHGWTQLALKSNMVAVMLVVPAILWATPRYGVKGAAVVWVLLNLGYLVLSVHFMFKNILVKEKLYWYKNDVIKPLALAYLAALSLKLMWKPNVFSEDIVELVLAFALALAFSFLGAGKLQAPFLRAR